MKYGIYKENFIDEADAAASVAASRAVKVGGTVGSVYAVAVAGEGGLTVSAGTTVTLSATESNEFEGEYASNGVTSARTFAEETTFVEGDVVAELPFTSYAALYAKVALELSAAGDGKIKVISQPRG